MFKALQGHPAINLVPDLNAETMILRDAIEGRKVQIGYDDTTVNTHWFRNNLEKIT